MTKTRIWIAVGAVVAVAAVVAAFVVGAALLRAAADTDSPAPRGPGGGGSAPQGERLAPPGAPFSYALPEGWVRAVHQGAPGFMTSVGPPVGQGKTSIVGVAVVQDGDTASAVWAPVRAGTVPPTGVTVTATELDGHRAMRVEFDMNPGGSYEFVQLKDGRVVYLLCQWVRADDRHEAEQGCESVRSTLEITAA